MTTPDSDPRFQRVARKVIPQGTAVCVWSLTGGISASMTALAVETPEGKTHTLIVRRPGDGVLDRNPQAAHEEFSLLQTLHSLDIPVQTPRLLDDSGEIFDAPYLIVDYVAGEPEFAPADVTGYARQCAASLASIHRVDSASANLPFLAQRAAGGASYFGSYPMPAAESLAARCIYDTLAAVWPLSARNAPVLLHGDYWPGNLLWRDGRLVAVIDWEDAKLGDPLNDLAISRLDMLCIFGEDAMHAFTDHYLSLMDVDTAHLPYWDLYAALRLVRLANADFASWAEFYPPFGRPDITEQTMLDNYRSFLTQAFDARPPSTAGQRPRAGTIPNGEEDPRGIPHPLAVRDRPAGAGRPYRND